MSGFFLSWWPIFFSDPHQQGQSRFFNIRGTLSHVENCLSMPPTNYLQLDFLDVVISPLEFWLTSWWSISRTVGLWIFICRYSNCLLSLPQELFSFVLPMIIVTPQISLCSRTSLRTSGWLLNLLEELVSINISSSLLGKHEARSRWHIKLVFYGIWCCSPELLQCFSIFSVVFLDFLSFFFYFYLLVLSV
jgi:hypothetical protein